MSEYVEIYGSNIKLPERPKDEDAINYGKPRNEQKWERGELPSIFDNVEYGKDGKLKLNNEQSDYAEVELERCRNGVWIWIGERMRYITGRYYFYLKYYILEDGNPPEFREADRLYFIFWNYWFNILWCLGIIRIKKRRQGASSQSCSNILYEAIFFKNSNCGLLSKTRDDSKATFTEMVTNAYQLLPPFFKQRLQGKEESVTELVLLHDKGGNSKINYKAPVLNAYDRGRMSYVLGDEFGKLPLDVPASRLLAIISKTLAKGVKRVGWIDLPSTVNELTKGGGAEYKRIFDAANQFKKKPTTNRIVRFFQAAYEAYEGFIDEFGDSVIDKPTEEQYSYLVSKWVQRNEDGELISELSEEDISLGAKVYVMHKRREGLEGTDLEEEVRMNPCDEDEAFMYAGQGCEFNAANIKKQIKELEDNPVFLRKMRFVPEKEIIKSIVIGKKDKERIIGKPMDDEKGEWLIYELPKKHNHWRDNNGYIEPLNTETYGAGADTTKENPTPTTHGSKPVIVIMNKITKCIVAMYVGNPRLPMHMDEQALLGCKIYGCRINYEIDARTDYYRYFCKNNASAFLCWTPKIMLNPVKKNNKIEPGVRSGDIFQFAQQTTIIKSFIDGTDKDVYNGYVQNIYYISVLKQLLRFDISNRTEFDEVIALIMALVEIFAEIETASLPQMIKPIQILPTYNIKVS